MSKRIGLVIALLVGATVSACNHGFNDSESVSLPVGIDVVVIDSCEYIRALSANYSQGVSIVHKANCPNHGGKP